MISLSELANPNFDPSTVFQVILSRYYRVPFQISQIRARDANYFAITDPAIERCTHGAMHAARVAAYIKVIHLFRQEHEDLIPQDLSAFANKYHLSLTQLIHLVQLSGLFHDAAREDEGIDCWDRESAQIALEFFRTSMESLPDSIAQLLSNTIAYKDQPNEFRIAAQALGFLDEHQPLCEYLRQLVHDADCLDVMRVRKKFKVLYLDLMKSAHTQETQTQILRLVHNVRDLIHQQGDQYFDCLIEASSTPQPHEEWASTKPAHFNVEHKCTYEHDDNVYTKIIADFQGYTTLAKIYEPILEDPLIGLKPCLI